MYLTLRWNCKIQTDHKAIEPKTHGDVTKKPESRGEVIRMGRASLVDDPVCGAAQGMLFILPFVFAFNACAWLLFG